MSETAEPSDWDFSLVVADVQKAYPRVVRSAMQQVLFRSGVPAGAVCHSQDGIAHHDQVLHSHTR